MLFRLHASAVVPFFSSECLTARFLPCWDERDVFLFGYGAFLGAITSTYVLRSNAFVLRFPSLQRGRVLQLKAGLLACLLRAFFLTSVALFIYPFISINIHLLLKFDAPVSVPFTAGHNAISGWNTGWELLKPVAGVWSSALWKELFLAGFFLCFFWQFSIKLVQVTFTQELTFAKTYGRGAVVGAIVEGMCQEADPLLRHLSFLELARVAEYSGGERAHVFLDHSGQTWRLIAHAQCLPVIDAFSNSVQQSIEMEKMEAKGKRKWWARPWLSTRQSPVPRSLSPSLIIWSIEALAQLVRYSRTEDEFGVVQIADGVQNVLLSFLGCLLAIEQLNTLQSLPFYYNIITIALHRGIYLIVTTFYEHLSELRFPPPYARRLQSFVQFRD
jgi:hypothetical protein